MRKLPRGLYGKYFKWTCSWCFQRGCSCKDDRVARIIAKTRRSVEIRNDLPEFTPETFKQDATFRLKLIKLRITHITLKHFSSSFLSCPECQNFKREEKEEYDAIQKLSAET